MSRMPPSPEISVVVPVRDRESYIGGLCEALNAQTIGADRFEVVMVDDGSVDRTPEYLESWRQANGSRRVVIRGDGKGPAYARNLGVRAAKSEWIAFTDSDTVPLPDWLERALQALEESGAEALEGAVEPWPREAIGPHTHQIDTDVGGRYMTANMVYRRDLLLRLGGFDERFEQPFLEDSDIAFRVMDAGLEIPFVPEVRVRHHVRIPSPSEVLESTKKLRWIALFAGKHPDRYRTHLRPVLRPLSSVDIDVLLALLSGVSATRTNGLSRLALLAVLANGVRRGFASHQVFRGGSSEIASRAALSVALPLARAFWWLEGCARFRKMVW